MIPNNQFWLNNGGALNPLNDGLLWYYKFNQNTLKSKGKQDGIGVNLTYLPDTTGYKGVFTGNSRMYIDDSSDFDLVSNPFTIEIDVEFTTINERRAIFGQNNTSGSDTTISISTEIQADNKIAVYFFYSNTLYFALTSVNTCSLGVKYIILIKRSGDDFILKINDVVEDTHTQAVAVNISFWKMAVGNTGEFVDSSFGLKGYVSLFRGWNRWTTDAEDTELYNGGLGLKFNSIDTVSTDLLQTQLINGNPVAYSTFQSTSQRTVVNDNGIFVIYTHSTTQPVAYHDQTWFLQRSTDNGRTFQTVYTGTAYDQNPILETDSLGNLYVANITSDTSVQFLKFLYTDYTTPATTVNVTIPYSSKHCSGIDVANNRYYYFGSNLYSVIMDLDLAIIQGYTEIATGGVGGIPMYPSLTIDPEGNLYLAWVNTIGVSYNSINWCKSTDFGLNWTKADGTALVTPFVSDPSGPTDQITLVGENNIGTWLGSWAYVNGKLHAAFWYLGNAMKYVRINPATGAKEVPTNIVPFGINNADGAFFRDSSGTIGAPTPLYYYTSDGSSELVQCFKSVDNGATWTSYADRYAIIKGRLYSMCGYREQVDGMAYGVFTVATVRAITYTENDSGYTYFTKITLD